MLQRRRRHVVLKMKSVKLVLVSLWRVDEFAIALSLKESRGIAWVVSAFGSADGVRSNRKGVVYTCSD